MVFIVNSLVSIVVPAMGMWGQAAEPSSISAGTAPFCKKRVMVKDKVKSFHYKC